MYPRLAERAIYTPRLSDVINATGHVKFVISEGQPLICNQSHGMNLYTNRLPTFALLISISRSIAL